MKTNTPTPILLIGVLLFVWGVASLVNEYLDAVQQHFWFLPFGLVFFLLGYGVIRGSSLARNWAQVIAVVEIAAVVFGFAVGRLILNDPIGAHVVHELWVWGPPRLICSVLVLWVLRTQKPYFERSA